MWTPAHGVATESSTRPRPRQRTRLGASGPWTTCPATATASSAAMSADSFWAEKQPDEIIAAAAEAGAAAVGLVELVLQVSGALYPAIRGIVVDAVMQRARALPR